MSDSALLGEETACQAACRKRQAYLGTCEIYLTLTLGVFLRDVHALCYIPATPGTYPSLKVSEEIGDLLGNQQMARRTL